MATRKSGVLLHISSLPGKYGIGTLGKSAYKFIDFISEAGFSYWEILPLTMTSISNSPYQGLSAFGLNQYFIDYEMLIKDKLLTTRDLSKFVFTNDARKTDYKRVFTNSNKILKKAFKRFKRNNDEFRAIKANPYYKNYAIYMTLKENNRFKAWYDWNLRDRYYSPDVEKEVFDKYGDKFDFYIFTQYIFLKQWRALKEYANSKGIKIIGEIPFYLGYDCDAVYTQPELFMLDNHNMMKDVAGFPPDDFSREGQIWGNPLYNWAYMRQDNYSWWNGRFNQAFELFDYVKVNHFGGFYKAYAINFRNQNARSGKFVYGPYLDFFDSFNRDTIFANDLGALTVDVERFTVDSNFFKVRTMISSLFKFKKTIEKSLPSELDERTLAYIGNHDNLGLRPRIKQMNKDDYATLRNIVMNECFKLGVSFDSENIMRKYLADKIVELLYASKAEYVTLTTQDILYQDKYSRMNIPGVYSKNNWTYRILLSDLTPRIKDNLKKLNKLYGRNQENN